jgi:HEAT repeat protein
MTTVLKSTVKPDSLLAGKSVEELLYFVADDDQGFSAEATDLLLAAGIEAVYPDLERGLRDDNDADFRNGSMDILVSFGKESVPYLVKLLKDPNEEVRNFACVMLGDIGNREAVYPLIKTLNDEDANVGHSAAEALGKIGDRAALFPLIELLKGEFWVQFSAIAAIGAMRDYRAVPHLLDLLDNELLAGAAADALGKIGDPRALPPLGTLLPRMDDDVAGQAAQAIMEIYRTANEQLNYKNSLTEYHQPDHLRKVLGQAGVDQQVLEAVVMLLGWYGKVEAIEGFLPLLKDESLHDAVEAAILSLGRKADQYLLSALDDADDTVKVTALRSLRYLGNDQCVGHLAGFLASAERNLQLEAIETVKSFPDETFIPQLLAIVEKSPLDLAAKAAEALTCYRFPAVREVIAALSVAESSEARMRGAMLLGQFTEESEPRLLDVFLQDGDAEVRKTALKAAPKQGIDVAVPRLGAAFLDSALSVRVKAVQTIAEFHKPLLVDDMLALLGAGDEEVDHAVIKSLGIMGARQAENSLLDYLEKSRPSGRIEYALLETLGKITAASASRLICDRYLCSDIPDIRRLAVETLGSLGDASSLKAVESALHDRHWSVRVAALQVMGRLGGIWEIPFLLNAIEDPDNLVRKHAILALGSLRSHLAIPALVQQLDDMDMSRHAFCALLNFGQQILPWLHRHMLKSYPVDIRVRLIDLIGKFGSRRSVEPLMELLEDPSPTIRLAAIDSLAFCFDAMLPKKLTAVKKYDLNDEVKERAELALKTFTMEKYN